ncbi:hypothetical protein ZIOFF_031522 [Zingiber officinale]|uniref:Uncharacterized protein n=1 Tax=Zingiber officinale TaxID=94328 RepID=A0A8J5GDL4_ZINOF|nr:hypothetical protein ZIOFF_031522 [Zingiber officinale]
MAMARSLFKGTDMPARFRGETVRHAVYLLNRLPTKAPGERTPFEAWMGRKPHLAHLRVFGCVAYVKNAAPHVKKLDDKSSPMVYLGVEEGYKAHRANNEERVPEFMVVNAFGTDEVIVVVDIEVAAEDVTTPAVAVAGASSPSTSSSNTNTASSPSITNSPESYEGPVRFRSIADIYANTEEVVGIDEEEGEVMMVISEESTCYQEAAAKACWSLEELGFKKCAQEHVVYTRGEEEERILVGVPVIFCQNGEQIHGKAYNHASQGGQTNSQKQKTVALSSCEAEFMVATTAACHALWLRSLANELTGVEPKPHAKDKDGQKIIRTVQGVAGEIEGGDVCRARPRSNSNCIYLAGRRSLCHRPRCRNPRNIAKMKDGER